MKAGWKLFTGLAVFYFIVGIIYWLVGGEAVGITAIPLSGGLAALVGYYLWFTNRRLGQQPEDNLEGEISDNAGEIGFYSPHSWWPLRWIICNSNGPWPNCWLVVNHHRSRCTCN